MHKQNSNFISLETLKQQHRGHMGINLLYFDFKYNKELYVFIKCSVVKSMILSFGSSEEKYS